MYDIVGRRPLWYVVTLILIVPGIVFMIWSMFTYGTLLPLNIDYTGGTLWELRFDRPVEPEAVRQLFVENGYTSADAYTVGDDQTVQVKFANIDIAAKEDLTAALTSAFGAFEERSYRSIGPTIGGEVSRAALGAVVISSVGILIYIAWAFRQVAHAFRYGTCAIIALVHDVLVTVTFVGIMHWVAGWEVDALFLTAILTVIGFSVNDTIVIFDRIRENLRRHRGEDFATIANRSILETLNRSLATQFTVFLVMVALLLFGGGSIRQFMSTMFVGMVSGAYSTIFIATPLLVAWEERSLLGHSRKSRAVTNGNTPVTV
ncbi:MAG: protein translocase subunit SecF [Chloroflexi bacterium]|nr:MAG: protein translocase subunit SecF [Chloroflexota bacterium]